MSESKKKNKHKENVGGKSDRSWRVNRGASMPRGHCPCAVSERAARGGGGGGLTGTRALWKYQWAHKSGERGICCEWSGVARLHGVSVAKKKDGIMMSSDGCAKRVFARACVCAHTGHTDVAEAQEVIRKSPIGGRAFL